MANAEWAALERASRRPSPRRAGKPQLVAALAREPKLIGKHPALSEFLRTRWPDAAFMTAAGMAEAVGLPTTTLIRLLAVLGYPSFRAFRDAVRAQLRSR